MRVCFVNRSISLAALWLFGLGASASASYVNPLMNYNTPDPWVYRTNGYYYHTRTTGGNVRVFRSSTLEGLASATAVTVFSPNGEIVSDIWAPELHYLDGKWYIYSTGNTVPGGSTMRMFVLEGTSQNPQGSYAYKGIIDTNLPAIDATVLVRPSDGAKFLVWSQFDSYGQSLYTAALANPWALAGPGVRISSPTYSWEKNGNVNEGPEILRRNGKTFIIYSASGTWTQYYCLGMLANTDGNYTNRSSWTKFSNPVFKPSAANGTYCVGHCSFTQSPSGAEDWLVYHGTSDPSIEQISHRYTRIQRFSWNTDDTPNFDCPTPAGVALLSPDEAPGKPEQGLFGEYFNTANLSGASTLATNYTMDFNWGSGAPLLSIGSDAFSARWSGMLYAPVSGSYTFKTAHDDGVRLWVKGGLLVDDWRANSLKTNSAVLSLSGNTYYPVRLEYYHSSGSASVGLRWVPPGGSEEIVPGKYLFPFTNGLCGEYFSDINLTQRALTRLEPTITFNWGTGIPGLGLPSDKFSARWTGRVEPNFSGLYTFYVNSANGRRLWVNQQLIIDKWLDNWDVEYSGTINLQAGQKYDLKLEYFANLGAASCQLSWSSQNQPREIIPTSRLFQPFNQPPSLQTVPAQSILAGRTLTVTNTASDADIPVQFMTFSLISAPAGAVLNPTNGVLSWRPAISQAGITHPVGFSVTDSGFPPMSATQTFAVAVLKPVSPLLSSVALTNDHFSFLISGDNGPDYVIEAADDLPGTNWTTVFRTNAPVLPFVWDGEWFGGKPKGFFRVLLAP